MIKVLFVCHGNICRSPMGEYIFKDLVRQAGVSDNYEIASAATSREELGNPVYPPARAKLSEHGIDCSGHHARQITRRDYENYDLLIAMDRENLYDINRICGADTDGKVHLLLEYTNLTREIADPWYTRDFETAWKDISAGCKGLLEALEHGNL